MDGVARVGQVRPGRAQVDRARHVDAQLDKLAGPSPASARRRPTCRPVRWRWPAGSPARGGRPPRRRRPRPETGAPAACGSRWQSTWMFARLAISTASMTPASPPPRTYAPPWTYRKRCSSWRGSTLGGQHTVDRHALDLELVDLHVERRGQRLERSVGRAVALLDERFPLGGRRRRGVGYRHHRHGRDRVPQRPGWPPPAAESRARRWFSMSPAPALPAHSSTPGRPIRSMARSRRRLRSVPSSCVPPAILRSFGGS